ncbi:MAG: DUF2019 domain-containing protein [Beijerinckiaceae bacterium]|jgi:hypothetical protein|nr:DUF2019 domain-containing protein [Beijerinckiaceae bacterium]
MKKGEVAKLITPELVARFEKLALDQEVEMLAFRNSRYNKLLREITDVLEELKSRDGDRRRDVLKFLAHESLHVRFVVASHCNDLDPARSRTILREIADYGMQPYALNAGMDLYFMERLERGEMP